MLLLDYWASWCAPCIKELPHLQRLHDERSQDGFVALAINVDENAASAAESAKRLGLTMMIGLNEPEVKMSLGVHALPTLLAYDREGRLRGRWDGYKTGFEKEIASKVDKLLAGDLEGTTRAVATVIVGAGKLEARWHRDLPAVADGVVGLPADASGGARVVASSADQLVTFDAKGEIISKVRTESSAGRLLDFGVAADGSRELVGYRTGATGIAVIGVRSGTQRTVVLPAPLLDVAAVGGGKGGDRRLAIATMRGAAIAKAGDAKATLVDGAAGVRAVAPAAGDGILALHDNGTIGQLDPVGASWPQPAAGAERILAASSDGAITASRSVIAAVAGHFLPGKGRQVAVATYSGRLALIDEATGEIELDAAWPGVKELAIADLDGDGRDELLVASGRSVTALGAAARPSPA